MKKEINLLKMKVMGTKQFEIFCSLMMKCGYTIDDALTVYGILSLSKELHTKGEVDELFDTGLIQRVATKLKKNLPK